MALSARLAAARGDTALAHTLSVTTDELTETTGATSYPDIARTAVGTAHLASGRYQDAVEVLEAVRTRMLAGGFVEHSLFAPTFGDYIEALIRSGDDARARSQVAEELPRAMAGGLAASLAVAYRCRAQVSTGGEADYWYAKALRCHEQSPDPYELARTRLALGRTLRETDRPEEARAALTRAADGFAKLGSAPWLKAAAAEL